MVLEIIDPGYCQGSVAGLLKALQAVLDLQATSEAWP
jgi:hypothetical protein